MIPRIQALLPLTLVSKYISKRAFSDVRPSKGSIDQVSSPNSSISDNHQLRLENVHIKSNLPNTTTNNQDHLLNPRIQPSIVISVVLSPHCPQLLPRDLPLNTNWKNAVKRVYSQMNFYAISHPKLTLNERTYRSVAKSTRIRT